jgi:hypothetical protein
MTNPPTGSEVKDFKIRTKTGSFYLEQYTLNLTMTQVATLSIINVIASSRIVSTNTTYSFRFSLSAPLSSSHQIIIEFSDEFVINSYSTFVSGIILKSSVKSSVSSNKITLTSGISGYFDENFSCDFRIQNVMNPYSTEPALINILVLTENSEIVANSTTNYSFSSTVGSFSSVSIQAADATIYSTTTYTFSMNLDKLVKSTSYLILTFPSEISVSNQAKSNCNVIKGLQSGSKCEVLSSKLNISECFPSTFTGTISFNLSSITNPTTTKASSAFSIKAYSKNNYEILSNALLTFTAIPGVFTGASISSSSGITGDSAIYKISVTLVHKIPAGGIISVIFPQETSVFSITCPEAIGLSSPFTCSSSGVNVTFFGGFSSEKTSGTVILTVAGVRNPRTTEPSSTAKVYSMNNGFIIDQIETGLSVTMTTPNILKSVSITQTSLVIGGKTDLIFTVTPFNPVYSGGTVQIFFPDTVIQPSTPSCEAGNQLTSVTCSKKENYIEATLTLSSSTLDTAFSLTIKECTNPKNSKVSETFKLFTFYKTYSIDKIETGVNIQANTPGLLTFELTLEDYGILETTEYYFIVSHSNQIPENGTLEISLDDSLVINDPPECSFFKSCDLKNSSVIIGVFNEAVEENSKSYFSIKNITNANSANFNYTINLTSKYDSYLIDSGSYSLTFKCHSNCSTCSESADKCLTCLQKFPYLYQDRCYSSCPAGTTSEKPGSCTICSKPCLECSGSSSTCTKCESPLVLSGNTCFDNCGEGKYNKTGSCESCINDCKICPNNTACSECNSNFSLYQGKCYSTCPSGTLKVDKNCEDCKFPCKTCETSTNTCTSCEKSYSLYEKLCLSECPANFASIDQNCIECSMPCFNCSGKTSQCTACYEDWLLYNSRCVESCPEETFQTEEKCEDCEDLCSVCEVSRSNCSECKENAFLFGNSCESQCPSTTTSINGVCEECYKKCETCSISVSNCTSCKDGLYFYLGTCVEICPENVTIENNFTCEPCEDSCGTCLGSTFNCSSCDSGLSLFNGSCMKECPEGFVSNDSVCVLYECVPGCNYFQMTDNNCDEICNVKSCNYDNDECSSSDLAGLKEAPLPFTITGVGTGGVMLGSKLLFPGTSLSSSLISVWGVVEAGSWLCILNEISLSQSTGRRLLSSDSEIQLAFTLLLVFFVGHLLINITFGIVYFFNILQKDYTFKFWVSSTKPAKWAVVPFALLINFQFMRILDSKLFGCSCLNANYDKKSNLYKPLVLFTYISIVFTVLPMMGSLIYVLVIFDSDSVAFALALDSLLLTLCQLVLNIYDIVVLSLIIAQTSPQKKQVKNASISPHSELMNTQQFTIYNTKSDETERGVVELDITGKVFPEPEDEKDEKDARETKEFTMVENLAGTRETQDHIIFELESETYENSSKKQVFPVVNSRPDMWNISFEPFSPVKLKPVPRILDIIDEENDLDLSTAQLDEGSTIIANHIPSGRRVLISKTFKDSISIEDPDKLVINYDQYVLENVDPENIKVGTLRSKSQGTSIKVNRNFNQSQILDVEENGQWTIGKSVKKEENFDFAHAFQDPDNPEAVVVWNKVGKVYTIVKKDFKGVPKLDPKSNLPLFSERMISSYDPKTIQVDQKDVHFANLVCDGEKFRVRRNFIGGKILEVIDKDKYLDKKSRKVHHIEEPEVELKEEELEDIEPDIILPSEPVRRVKRNKKKKNKNWDNIEAIYLQRLEPTIQLKRPKPEVSNSLFGKMVDEAKGKIEMKFVEEKKVEVPKTPK